MQGLLGRPDWQEAAQLPFAMLPTGSGNALSANAGTPVTVATPLVTPVMKHRSGR